MGNKINDVHVIPWSLEVSKKEVEDLREKVEGLESLVAALLKEAHSRGVHIELFTNTVTRTTYDGSNGQG